LNKSIGNKRNSSNRFVSPVHDPRIRQKRSNMNKESLEKIEKKGKDDFKNLVKFLRKCQSTLGNDNQS